MLRILQENTRSCGGERGGGGAASSSSAGAKAVDGPGGGGGAGGVCCENEFVIKCLYRIFNFLKTDATPDVSLPALGVILEVIKRVSSNPSNPSFSHFLFESLATIVKILAVSREYRPTVEAQVVPVLSVLIQQTVHDFIPYCFQVDTLALPRDADRHRESCCWRVYRSDMNARTGARGSYVLSCFSQEELQKD